MSERLSMFVVAKLENCMKHNPQNIINNISYRGLDRVYLAVSYLLTFSFMGFFFIGDYYENNYNNI